MGGKYKFSEVELEEIRAARRANTNKRAEARLKALELRAKGKSSKEIRAVTSFHPAYITTLTAKYRAGGIRGNQWKPLWRKPPEHELGEGSGIAGRIRKAKRSGENSSRSV